MDDKKQVIINHKDYITIMQSLERLLASADRIIENQLRIETIIAQNGKQEHH